VSSSTYVCRGQARYLCALPQVATGVTKGSRAGSPCLGSGRGPRAYMYMVDGRGTAALACQATKPPQALRPECVYSQPPGPVNLFVELQPPTPHIPLLFLLLLLLADSLMSAGTCQQPTAVYSGMLYLTVLLPYCCCQRNQPLSFRHIQHQSHTHQGSKHSRHGNTRIKSMPT
jgi:hypothetical protein